jgi:hypothetical protein
LAFNACSVESSFSWAGHRLLNIQGGIAVKGARVQIPSTRRLRRPSHPTKVRLTPVAATQILEQMNKLRELASDKVQTDNLRFQVLVSARRIEQLLDEV